MHVEFLNTIVKYVDKALKSGVSEMTPKCMHDLVYGCSLLLPLTAQLGIPSLLVLKNFFLVTV